MLNKKKRQIKQINAQKWTIFFAHKASPMKKFFNYIELLILL